MSRTSVRAMRPAWDDSVHVAVVVVHENGEKSVAEPLTLRKLEPGHLIGEPTMRLTSGEAQQLIDELWRCGLRPTEGSGSAGSLAATERHLRDMQAIAFGVLNKDGVTTGAQLDTIEKSDTFRRTHSSP